MKQFSVTDEEKAQGRRIFAGNVISEMLDAENSPKRNLSKDFKVHELVNGGKLKQLAEVIMTFSKFEEVIAANYPNTKTGIDMLIDGTNPLLHRNANNVLMDMNESIKLAEEEEKKQPKVEEKQKDEAEPKVEKNPKVERKSEEENKPEQEKEKKLEEEKKTEAEPNKP